MANSKILELSVGVEISNSDSLMVSRPRNADVYSSYKVNVSTFKQLLPPPFEELSSATISGSWRFTGRGRLCIDNSNIVSANSIINKEYVDNNFLSVFTMLSNDIYNKPHIPSCVGEIIYSTTLNTVEKVKQKYGQYTEWEKVNGRFIMTTNSKTILDGQPLTTGEVNVTLTVDNIPPHAHAAQVDTTPKMIRVNKSIPINPQSLAFGTGTTGKAAYEQGVKDGMYVYTNGVGGVEGRPIKLDMVLEGKAKTTVAGPGKIAITIGKNSGGNVAHNNIPPFYSVYMWRRRA